MAKRWVNGMAMREIRRRSEISVRTLVDRIAAEGISVHEDHIYNIELGRRQPSPQLLGAIARGLKCPKGALLLAGEDTRSVA